MRTSIVGSKAFEQGCRSFIVAAMWATTVTDNEKFEYLDQMCDQDDCSEEALAWVAGEVFTIANKLCDMGKLEHLSSSSMDVICTGLALQAVGSGGSLKDRFVFDFDTEERDALADWYDERWGVRTLDLYRGDDSKVYIGGCERRKPVRIRMSMSEDPGRFGAMHEFSNEAVSVDEVALRAAKMMHDEQWKKTWIKGYEEIPA